MTHESSNDSPPQETRPTTRREARAAREQAVRGGSTAPTPSPGAPEANESVQEAPAAVDAGRTTASAGDEERLRVAAGERTKALEAAQRARTQSALRARQEAIEAQRAAAERVRQTLRAKAAPLRERSAGPDAPDTAPGKAAGNTSAVPGTGAAAAYAGSSAATSATDPYDQEARLPGEGQTGPSPAVAAPQPPPAAPSKPPVVPAKPPTAPTVPTATPQPAIDEGRERENAVADTNIHDAAATEAETVDASLDTGDHQMIEAEAEAWDWEPAAGDSHESEAHEYDPAHPDSGEYAEYHEGLSDTGIHPADHGHGLLERENLFLTSGSTSASARRARRRRRNWIVTAVLLGFCAVIFGIALFLQGLLERLNPSDFPGPGGEAVTFEVKPGWGPNQIGRELENREIVASDKLFLESIQLVEAENREIHPGTYELRREMPALDAATILIGEPAQKVSYIAIKQNTRMTQVLEEIAKSTGLEAATLESLARDPKAFGISSGASNLEGYLHPGEYRFPVDTDAKTVLQAMVDATTKTLEAAGITEAKKQYHVLKVASILQAEARPNDYGTVAGALENRLHPDNTETNGLLQVDSSVIYGLNRYTLQISESEKTDAGNPYNSYVHKGLPPTPIGSPGDPAIKAAANPTPNDYYYWVTVNTNTGETKFAKTYSEHLVNQNEFRAWCAANTDVCK